VLLSRVWEFWQSRRKTGEALTRSEENSGRSRAGPPGIDRCPQYPLSPMAPIRFGTDGWRAVIAEDFTFANLAA